MSGNKSLMRFDFAQKITISTTPPSHILFVLDVSVAGEQHVPPTLGKR